MASFALIIGGIRPRSERHQDLFEEQGGDAQGSCGNGPSEQRAAGMPHLLRG